MSNISRLSLTSKNVVKFDSEAKNIRKARNDQAPSILSAKKSKLRRDSFMMEVSFSDALNAICKTEDIPRDRFISSTVQIAILKYFRERCHTLKPQAYCSKALQEASLLKYSQMTSGLIKSTSPPLASNEECSASITLSVLVVDDIFMNRDIAGSFLQAAGHKVTCVASGKEAVTTLGMANFDVILMDVVMPEMDGLETTRRIRALGGGHARLPIIALSALSHPKEIQECYEAGMDYHLAKPFNPDTLCAAVLRAAQPDQPAASISAVGSDNWVFNKTAFERTACHLSPEKVYSFIKGIFDEGEGLICQLEGQDTLVHKKKELSQAACAIAGSAGMFGFEYLTTVSRQFEEAVRTDGANALVLAKELNIALKATLDTLLRHHVIDFETIGDPMLGIAISESSRPLQNLIS